MYFVLITSGPHPKSIIRVGIFIIFFLIYTKIKRETVKVDLGLRYMRGFKSPLKSIFAPIMKLYESHRGIRMSLNIERTKTQDILLQMFHTRRKETCFSE